MTEASKQLRNALADHAVATNKGQDKIVKKLDELDAKKDKRVSDSKEAKKTSQQAILSQIEGVEKAVKDQKVVEKIEIKNPEAITGDLKAGLGEIVGQLIKVVAKVDREITVKNDLGQLATLFKGSQDKKAVIDALKKIEDKLEKPEITDYTLILSDIAEALEAKNNDDVVLVLKDILAKDHNVQFPDVMPVDLDPNLIEDDRVKTVLPDEQVAKMSKAFSAGNNSQPIIDLLSKGVDTFFINVAFGNIPGAASIGIGGNNPSIVAGQEETLWSQGGKYVYLEDSTQLYVSSSDAADVGKVWVFDGVDKTVSGDLVKVLRIGVLNGQNQVALSGTMYRVFRFINISSTTTVGDMYLAESDDLTAGVPDTTSKIKGKALAGKNGESMGLYTTPTNKQSYAIQLEGGVGKAKDVEIIYNDKFAGGSWVQAFPFPNYQAQISFIQKAGFVLDPGEEIELSAIANDSEASVTAIIKIIETDL